MDKQGKLDRIYTAMREHFDALGLSGYTQDAESAESAYTPPFDLTGVLNR